MKTTKYFLVLLVLLASLSVASAQQQGTPQAFSLQQAIRYALQNQPTIKNAQIQSEIARAKVGEVKATGLPQINGAIDIGNNLNIQTSFLPGIVAGQPDVPFIPVQFGTQYSSALGFSGSQMVFNGSYLLGLKAANVYTDLATKQVQQTELDILEGVTKAYYSVLVSRERLTLLDRNLARLESLLRETTQIQRQGFAEKIDVDRMQVSYNNLKVEKDKAERLVALGVDLLRFQMSLNLAQPIELTDKLDNVVVETQQVAAEKFDYPQRIEYSILQTQRDLAVLDLRNRKVGYYPTVSLTGRVGWNTAGNDFAKLFAFGEKNMFGHGPYYNYSFVGLSVQFPVFDGLRRHYQIKQGKLALQSLDQGAITLQNSIDLQIRQSNTNLQNALQVLQSQKESLALAQEVARVANVKFKEGVGSNLEVITAETDLRQAQTNYYSALYDAVITKVDLEKATGTLKR
ncbi:TolC family protein [Adhaeribacter aquaticus]|uniref:TolC family protein n=1 Tax=Adhaeribacter aquaticus TaxID=299567 RepID=UPI0003F5E6D8|nr:TolC family protein [Adhaeribacter aquaticus]